MIVYMVLLLAVVFEVFGDSMMKLSNGFEHKLPLVGTVIGYGVAFYLISQVLNFLPLGPVYAIWTGLGIAVTAVVGAIFWKEAVNAKKIIGIILIVAGVVVLEMGM